MRPERACRSRRPSAGSARISATRPVRGRKRSTAEADAAGMARRPSLLLVLALFAVLAGSATAAATKAGDPQKRHNAADQSWAERMRIQRSDLGAGDWRVEQHSDDDSGLPKQCKDPNLSDLVETGSAEKPTSRVAAAPSRRARSSSRASAS